MVADAIGRAISSHHTVVGLARDSAEALACATKCRPELFLLDISLGNENGLALIRPLLTIASGSAVIVLTMFATPGFQTTASRLGARGFISKAAPTEDLMRAIAVVGGGGVWSGTGPTDVGSVASALDASMRLTLRQIEVVKHLSRGMSYKEIAGVLGMAEDTVDAHLRRIRGILGARNAVELVWQAARHGFIAADLEPQAPSKRSHQDE
jgi:DNA-binding NarL/FixJ family response regulator